MRTLRTTRSFDGGVNSIDITCSFININRRIARVIVLRLHFNTPLCQWCIFRIKIDVLSDISEVNQDVNAWLERGTAGQITYYVLDEVLQVTAMEFTRQAKNWFNYKGDFITMSWTVAKIESKIVFSTNYNIILLRKTFGRYGAKVSSFSNFVTIR